MRRYRSIVVRRSCRIDRYNCYECQTFAILFARWIARIVARC